MYIYTLLQIITMNTQNTETKYTQEIHLSYIYETFSHHYKQHTRE